MENSKKIKILTKGVIHSKGLIYGPVLTPYMETLDNIFTLLADGVHIVEVLNDGTELKLDITNFKNDNNFKPEVLKQEVVPEDTKDEVKPEEAPVVEADEEATINVEQPVEEVVDENVKIAEQPEKFKPEYNHNKNKKQNNKNFAKDNK